MNGIATAWPGGVAAGAGVVLGVGAALFRGDGAAVAGAGEGAAAPASARTRATLVLVNRASGTSYTVLTGPRVSASYPMIEPWVMSTIGW